MDGETVRRWIQTKIGDATLERSPFPHLIVEQFFPADVYDKILRFNPFKENRGTDWKSESSTRKHKASTPYYARKQINFHEDEAFATSDEARAFWGELKGLFLSGDRWFEKLVFDKYREYFVIRFGDLARDEGFFDVLRTDFFLHRHDEGYFIGPHTDVPKRIFTCIFAFADEPGFDEYGTQLCAPKDPLVRCWGCDHHDPEAFEVKKVAPYKPNNFLLFFKTRQSFHSVKRIDEAIPNQRYGMQFQSYEPGNGLFTDLSVPDLMSSNLRKDKRGVKKLLSAIEG